MKENIKPQLRTITEIIIIFHNIIIYVFTNTWSNFLKFQSINIDNVNTQPYNKIYNSKILPIWFERLVEINEIIT